MKKSHLVKKERKKKEERKLERRKIRSSGRDLIEQDLAPQSNKKKKKKKKKKKGELKIAFEALMALCDCNGATYRAKDSAEHGWVLGSKSEKKEVFDKKRKKKLDPEPPISCESPSAAST